MGCDPKMSSLTTPASNPEEEHVVLISVAGGDYVSAKTKQVIAAVAQSIGICFDLISALDLTRSY